MKTMLGATIGALTVGALVLAYNATGVGSEAIRADRLVLDGDQARLVSDGPAGTNQLMLTSSGVEGPVVVSCEPGQRVVVSRGRLDGQLVSQIECASIASDGGSLRSGGAFNSNAGIGDARLVRVSSSGYERPVYVERAPARRVVRSAPTRTWQKSALIIGGTAGAGAGIGAAVGGKKGALLGAAIGGGAATLYDQLTRRRDR